MKPKELPKPDFDSYFPLLMSELDSLPLTISLSKLADIDDGNEDFHKHFAPAVFPEIERTIPRWAWLRTQGYGLICFHIVRMLYCTIKDKDFGTLDAFQANALKWTVILHDIAKRAEPTLPPEARDPAHPYHSAADAVDVLANVVGGLDEGKAKALQKLIRESVIDDKVNDFSKLGPILKTTAELFGGSDEDSNFGYLVFKLVLMHQALPTLQGFGQVASMTQKQIKDFCSARFLRLMKLVMINDSVNYLMHDEGYAEYYRKRFCVLFDGYFKLVSSHDPDHQQG